MEVTLNKNGWHRKMQEFVFKDAPRYNSLCPYFWFTVFCVIFTFIIPIVPFVKVIKLIFTGAGMLLSGINNGICIPLMNSIIRGMDDSDIIKGWVNYSTDNYLDQRWVLTSHGEKEWKFWKEDFANVHETHWKIKEKSAERFQKWKSITPDWEAQIEAIKAKRREEYAKLVEESRLSAIENAKAKAKRRAELQRREDEARERLRIKAIKAREAVAKRQKMFTKIAVYTKWIAYVVVAAIVGAIGFGIYKLFTLVASCNIPWKTIGIVTLHIIVGLIATAAVLALAILITKLIKKCELKPSDSKFLRWIGRRFIGLWKIIVWISLELIVPVGLFLFKWIVMPVGGFFYGIWKGLGFIAIYLKSTKDGYCPAINWKEEDVNRN